MATNKIRQEMPHSLEAEQSLLGCILVDAKIQLEVVVELSKEDFYSESHKYIFDAMSDIIKTNQPIDLVSLLDVLEKKGELSQAGGITYITELTSIMPSSANYRRYFNIVKRNSTLRKLISSCTETIADCVQSMDEKQSLASAEKRIYEISNTVDTSDMVRIDSVLPEVMTKLDEISKNKGTLRGIPTGFKWLDALIKGVHKSDLMVLAARPAVGKTSFAMNIVENIAQQGYSCAVFSLEMGKEQLAQRMLCSIAGVSMENVVTGKLNRTEWLKIAKAKEILSKSKIFINDSSMINPREMLSHCRRLKTKYGLDFVMVDYIQLMSSDKRRNSENRQNEVADISRELKILAKEVNVPVLALSQLSRSSEKEKRRPQMADLRESGAIEQDADIIMFIHNPEKGASEKEINEGKVQKNVREILIEKHRNGPTGMVKLYFKGECTKFLNLNIDTGMPEGEDEESAPTKSVIAPSSELADINEFNDNTFSLPEDSLPEPPPENPDDEIFG